MKTSPRKSASIRTTHTRRRKTENSLVQAFFTPCRLVSFTKVSMPNESRLLLQQVVLAVIMISFFRMDSKFSERPLRQSARANLQCLLRQCQQILRRRCVREKRKSFGTDRLWHQQTIYLCSTVIKLSDVVQWLRHRIFAAAELHPPALIGAGSWGGGDTTFAPARKNVDFSVGIRSNPHLQFSFFGSAPKMVTFGGLAVVPSLENFQMTPMIHHQTLMA